MQDQNNKKIVVIGAGFGGMYSYLGLRRKFGSSKATPQITIINKQNYFLFTPLLHEVATGSVNRSNIVQPIRQLINDRLDQLFVGEVKRVDFEKQQVYFNCKPAEIDRLNQSADSAPIERKIDYDYLIISAGATTSLRNFDRRFVYTLKNIVDSVRLKNKIISLFEEAERANNPLERERLLTFTVIGGGATGVEIVAEISELVHTLLRLYPQVNKKEIKILLLHNADQLIPQFKSKLREKTLAVLRAKGIDVRLNSAVREITAAGITLEDNSQIPTALPVLVAGIEANKIDFSSAPKFNHKGQLEVNEYLQLNKYSNVFALGDIAQISGVPQTAQAATAEAKNVATNVATLVRGGSASELKKFKYSEAGQMLSLGRWMAVAEIYNFSFFGHFAWWVWRTNYASKLIGWANRFRVVLDWTIDMFYPRDTSKFD